MSRPPINLTVIAPKSPDLKYDEIQLLNDYRRMDHGDKEYFVLYAGILAENPSSGACRAPALRLVKGGA